MSSREQATLPGTSDRGHTHATIRAMRNPDVPDSLLSQYGLSTEWLGAQPADLPEDTPLYRYQYDRTYLFVRDDGEDGSKLEPVEFRLWICTAERLVSDFIQDYFKNTVYAQLQYIFDSGPYEGFMTGFDFPFHDSNIEKDRVDATEANNLGIPQFEVLVTRDGTQVGESNGFFDPFDLSLHRRVLPSPGHEVWGMTYQKARDSYRVSPPAYTNQRKRADRVSGKSAYVNGEYVGDVGAEGRIFLKKEYASDNQMYRGQVSRKYLVSNTDATYAALRDGGNLYKTRETADALYFVTAAAKPRDFDPVDPDEVDPDHTGEVVSESWELDFGAGVETDFDIRTDIGQLMGRYGTPTVRSTDSEREFNTVPFGAR